MRAMNGVDLKMQENVTSQERGQLMRVFPSENDSDMLRTEVKEPWLKLLWLLQVWQTLQIP